MVDYKARCRNLLEWSDEQMDECEGCGMVLNDEDVRMHSHGDDGIEVCPMCRAFEGFRPLEVGE